MFSKALSVSLELSSAQFIPEPSGRQDLCRAAASLPWPAVGPAPHTSPGHPRRDGHSAELWLLLSRGPHYVGD